MSRKELHRAHLLKLVVEGQLSLRNAATTLGVSYHQAKRLKRHFLKEDLPGLIHGNR